MTIYNICHKISVLYAHNATISERCKTPMSHTKHSQVTKDRVPM